MLITLTLTLTFDLKMSRGHLVVTTYQVWLRYLQAFRL